jgi:drug/metabolite transporter (DMT)-like permease
MGRKAGSTAFWTAGQTRGAKASRWATDGMVLLSPLERAFGRLPGTVRGAIWMILGGLFLTLLALVIRHLQTQYDVLQMIFLRSVVSFFLILPWAIKVGLINLKTRRIGLHVFRNTIHYFGNVGWFFGVTLVPLADLSALQFTVPLFSVVLAAIFLRESVGFHRWAATAIGFAGALVIIRPGFVDVTPGIIAVIASAVFYASSGVSTKALSRTDSPNAVLFYMSVIFIPISAIPAIWKWQPLMAEDTIPILLLGVFGWLAHFCIIRAFAAADASFVAPFDFLRLPIAALFGFFLYLEEPDLWVWMGAVIIFAATWYNTSRENRASRKAAE